MCVGLKDSVITMDGYGKRVQGVLGDRVEMQQECVWVKEIE